MKRIPMSENQFRHILVFIWGSSIGIIITKIYEVML